MLEFDCLYFLSLVFLLLCTMRKLKEKISKRVQMFLNSQPTIYGFVYHDIIHNLTKHSLADRSKSLIRKYLYVKNTKVTILFVAMLISIDYMVR